MIRCPPGIPFTLQHPQTTPSELSLPVHLSDFFLWSYVMDSVYNPLLSAMLTEFRRRITEVIDNTICLRGFGMNGITSRTSAVLYIVLTSNACKRLNDRIELERRTPHETRHYRTRISLRLI
ncbi:hypothetical protein C0J52_23453 [Blattella germanica]|nr:hypothetical protein C0J52_23453 [Blattella germanica]